MTTQLAPTDPRPRVTPYTIDRRISGTPAEVAATVATLRTSARLIAMSLPRQVADDPARVWVRVRILAPRPRTAVHATPRPVRRVVRRRWPVAVGVTAAGAAATGAVWAVVTFLAALAAHWPAVVGVLVLLSLLWLSLGRAGVCCPGLHCPGCKH
ncbi:hypothetical protein [Asanoa iriomotensis]|uniref:Uncharacterized protein n=1 Tax=Asanoa iriomotensis TaxID=234613 RepID=A0ABQ4CG41_9ACTN|nr:hypothetical protein [Asanoa iriomotensis]GIF61746.1 hypothetical protein Air01nite_78410 [Asanoa iriomotensis]